MAPKKKPYLSRNVLMTGLTSFLTDVSSEMIYPMLQGFVSAILKAQAALIGPVLGVIEGISESTASLMKVLSGYYSDRIRNRKAPAIAGYGFSAVSKFLYFIPLWFTVLLARFFDRVGKGVRTAPRDALIAESTPKESQGKAFGFQRGMDFAGAFLGTVVLFILIQVFFKDLDNAGSNPQVFYPVFIIAVIPSLLAVIPLFFTVDKPVKGAEVMVRRAHHGGPRPSLDVRRYDRNLRLFFLAQFIFTLGNSSNQFLLLQSTNVTGAFSMVLLMYIAFNLTTTVLSTFFGGLSDRIGRKALLVMGYALYAVVYIAFGFIGKGQGWLLWVFWPLYGVYYAMTEGVEKALVSDLAPKESKATALGFYNTIVGIGLLPASVIAGFLFPVDPKNHSLPFWFGGLMAVVTIVLLVFFVKEKKKK